MPDRFIIDKPGTEYQVSEWFEFTDAAEFRLGEYRPAASLLTEQEARDYIDQRTQDSEK